MITATTSMITAANRVISTWHCFTLDINNLRRASWQDIEQLLNYIGAESLGPRHVLANLKQLTTIIQSQQYISTD
jgi:hypothetical protein